tara:strand:+ start:592 stop:981 length:390 start_codon:yes stop_codon:yes gene_type:complete
MDIEQALFANDTFYLSFTQKDAEAMDRLWARSHPLICIHPDRHVLTKREEIISVWKSFFTNPLQPGIDFYNPVANDLGTTVLVTCYEEVSGTVLVATNGFVEEDNVIKMVHHQSARCLTPPKPISASTK